MGETEWLLRLRAGHLLHLTLIVAPTQVLWIRRRAGDDKAPFPLIVYSILVFKNDNNNGASMRAEEKRPHRQYHRLQGGRAGNEY